MTEGLGFAIGLILTAIFIPWIQKISLRMGYVDRPEGDILKIHSVPIPHSGGIVIFSAFGLVLALLSVFGVIVKVDTLGLLLGGSMVFTLGVWEDLKSTTPIIRLSIHALAAVEDLVVGDFLARVRGHATKARYEAGIDTAFGFVVGLVVANGFHQVVPFVLIWIPFLGLDIGLPEQVRAHRILALVSAGGHSTVTVL